MPRRFEIFTKAVGEFSVNFHVAVAVLSLA